MFICKSRPWKCKRTEFEAILVDKVSLHFLAQGRRRGPAKSSEKKIFWKSTNFMFNSNSRPWKCKRTAFESILAEKVSFQFLASGRRRGPVKKSEKNIFWKSTNFMFNSNSRPLKCKRAEFELILVAKVSSFFGSRPQARTCEKIWKKIYFENPPILCSISNSRPRKCKRTEFESILVEKVSFHFLAQGRRRGPAKSSEKNIFWKSTNFMFNSNSRPWKCKRTELESILVENSFLSIFWLKATGATLHRPAKSSEKNIFGKSNKFYVHLQKQALKMQTNSIRIDFGWKSFISFFGLRPQAQTCEKIWKKYILKIHQFYVQ